MRVPVVVLFAKVSVSVVIASVIAPAPFSLTIAITARRAVTSAARAASSPSTATTLACDADTRSVGDGAAAPMAVVMEVRAYREKPGPRSKRSALELWDYLAARGPVLALGGEGL